MNGWFLAIIILYTLELGINLVKHGENIKGSIILVQLYFLQH